MEVNVNTVCVADKPSIPHFPRSVSHACPKGAAILVIDCDPISVSFNVKVPSEAHPDGVALRNLDFLVNVEVVLIVFGVVRGGEEAACWLLSFRRSRTLKYV